MSRISLPILAALLLPVAAMAEDHAHWGYEGAGGPSHWAELSAESATCAHGTQQSPIDINGAIHADLPPLLPDWSPVKGTTVLNTGHTVQVNLPPGDILRRGDQTYELVQLHFHAPSEHTVNGRTYPMEAHFVHKNTATGALGVIGVFIEEGGKNAAFAELAHEFPASEGAEVSDDRIDPNDFLPEDLSYWAYEGSLTTPPCSEIVDWMVLRAPLQVAAEDIAMFRSLYEFNARPAAEANRRFILSSF